MSSLMSSSARRSGENNHSQIPKKPQPHPDPDEDDDVTARSNILAPRVNDVICGRGGKTLRHPGNRLYRQLVALNKVEYTKCVKTEKQKISKSIVAAIRESNGRFLEKDSKTGMWFDIGDQKAVSKTSQALRDSRQEGLEGSESENKGGGNGGGAEALLESQLKLEQQLAELAAAAEASPGDATREDSTSLHPTGNLASAPPAPSAPADPVPPAHGVRRDVSSELLNLAPALGRGSSDFGNEPGRRPSVLSLMSDFSMFSMEEESHEDKHQRQEFVARMAAPPVAAPAVGQFSTTAMAPPDLTNATSQGSMLTTSSSSSSNSARPDRRKMFKATKLQNGESGRTMFSDMPDIYMLESSPSLMSNISMIGDQVRQTELDALRMAVANHRMMELSSDPFGGSRRSIMSEVSRIDDHESIFSDLSRKIGNVSTRSFPMSDASMFSRE